MGGKAKTTQSTDQTTKQDTSFEQQATATPGELALNQQDQASLDATADVSQQGQFGAFNLINALLTGGNLPGFLGSLPGGISAETIGTQAARTAREAQPGFQSLGLADSGVAFRETAQDVGENVLFPAEQFNINNLFNLLQTGLSGQSSLQGQRIAQGANLGSRLAGLRKISGSGTGITNVTGTSTVLSPNPFVSNLQQSLGQGIGKGVSDLTIGGAGKLLDTFAKAGGGG
jgi:hypothetical protein